MVKQGNGSRIYYGWILVLTLAITETTSWGILSYAFTVFLGPMQAELGWSKAELTGAYSLSLLVAAVAGLAVGRWLDRHGPRFLMTVGSVLATLLVLAWSGVHDLLLFYLIWIAIGFTLAAVLYEPAFAVVATWFIRRRARALTLLTFVAGFASVIYIPLADWLVRTQGWRQALVTLAIILAVGTIPMHALLLRSRPEDLGLQPDGASSRTPAGAVTSTLKVPDAEEKSISARVALHGSAFWWMTVAFFLNTVALGGLSVHLIPFLIDHGYDGSFAASMLGLVGIMALPGRLVFTMLGEKLPRSLLAACLFSLQSGSLVVLLTAGSSTTGVIAFVVIFGIGFGAITPARAALVADFYGRRYYATINSVLALFATAARAIGPFAVSLAFDTLGNYKPAFWTLAAISAVAVVSIVLAENRRPSLNEATPSLGSN
jgi:MFS family permease